MNTLKEYENMLDIACLRLDKLKDEIIEKRYFEKQIFLGAGSKNPREDFSGQDISILYAKMNYCISLLGGMQQGDCDKEEIQKYEKEIKSIYEEIGIALGVK